MQKFAPVLFALALTGTTALAQAQTTTAPSAPASPATSTTTTTTTTTTATQPQAAGQPNFGELISSLSNMRAEIAKVQSLNGSSANNIRPVNVAQLNGADPAALNTALTRNQAQLNTLRSALSRVTVTTMTNEHITVAQFLADNRINVSQVVAADVNNGTLVLFYQK